MCVLFVSWFATGIVMVFAGFPRLDEERRLRRLPDLGLDPAPPAPAQALLRAAARGRIRLGMLGEKAVYRFVDGNHSAGIVSALDGAALPGLSALEAAQVADAFVRQPHSWTAAVPVARRDQWNATAPRESQFPLLRFDGGDPGATQVYVSLVTAEVVQATTRRDRIFAWAGAIPHWIYPIALRRHAEAWRRVVIVLSGAGALLCASGIVLGLWHWRPLGRRRASRYGASPYSDRWLRWHHIFGLCFGALALTWVCSGMFSLNPFRWSPGSGPTAEEEEALAGGPLRVERFVLPPSDALAACRREIRTREIELLQVAGRPFYLCRESPSATRLVRADAPGAAMQALERDAALAAGGALFRGRPIVETAVLDADDTYHYGRHRDPAAPRRVLRVRLGDADATWYYIDLQTAKIAKRMTSRARLERWLYHGLHSLDFPALYARRALWRFVIVTLCACGLALGIVALAVSVRWLTGTRSSGR